METTARGWRSTLLSSLLSAIAVCCGVLSIAQPSAPAPADRAVPPQWTAPAASASTAPLEPTLAWATTPSDPPRVSADRPDGSGGDSDDDDDGDNDDAPGTAVAPAPTTVTADGGHTQFVGPQPIGRRLSVASGDHSLRAPPPIDSSTLH